MIFIVAATKTRKRRTNPKIALFGVDGDARDRGRGST